MVILYPITGFLNTIVGVFIKKLNINSKNLESSIEDENEQELRGAIDLHGDESSTNNEKEMLDRIINGNFAVLTKESNLDLSDKAKSIIDLLDIKLVTIEPNDDSEERLKTVFEKYKAVLVRPDKYTYGGVEDISSLSEMIESLEKEFSLNT